MFASKHAPRLACSPGSLGMSALYRSLEVGWLGVGLRGAFADADPRRATATGEDMEPIARWVGG